LIIFFLLGSFNSFILKIVLSAFNLLMLAVKLQQKHLSIKHLVIAVNLPMQTKKRVDGQTMS
jgi:hypothetical protein